MDILGRLLVAAGIMGVLDFVWLGFIAKKLYEREIGSLLLDKPNAVAAGLFYALYVIGVVVFVVNPAIDAESWLHALAFGALFGLVAYATYDLTNLATLKKFTPRLVVIDMMWGTFITAAVAVGTYLITHRL